MNRVRKKLAMIPRAIPAIDKISALSHNRSQDVARPGAQCHADADFARPLAHRVGNHAVDSHRGQQERNSSERSEQHQQKAARSQSTRDHLVHGMKVRYHVVRIRAAHLGSHGIDQAKRIGLCAQHKRPGTARDEFQKAVRQLQFRVIGLQMYSAGDVVIQAAVFHVPDHSDDLGGQGRAHHDALADGILVPGKEFEPWLHQSPSPAGRSRCRCWSKNRPRSSGIFIACRYSGVVG